MAQMLLKSLLKWSARSRVHSSPQSIEVSDLNGRPSALLLDKMRLLPAFGGITAAYFAEGMPVPYDGNVPVLDRKVSQLSLIFGKAGSFRLRLSFIFIFSFIFVFIASTLL